MKKCFTATLVFLVLLSGIAATIDDVRVGNPNGKNFTPDVYQRIGWIGEGQKPPQDLTPAELANTLMGTDSIMRYSHGNTYPAVALPFGMNFWSPQTGVNGYGWAYTYRGGQIRGLKQTHQPSPWIGDYGAFSLMPVTLPLLDQFSRASAYNHRSEIAKPYYYKVRLDTWRVDAEVTATERAAVLRFTYPAGAPAFVVLDTMGVGGQAKFDAKARTLTGFVTNNRGGVPKNFRNYFIVQFDQPVIAGGGGKTGWVWLKPGSGGVVTARAASSFISPEQARLNLEREVGKKSFDEVMAEAKAVWEKELGRIEVSGGTLEERATFYSTLYRLLLFPRKFYEIDAGGKIIHYSPYDGKVHDGYMFTDNGFWDTFRAVYPFFTIMYPTLDGQIMQALVNAYKEGGWLPSWASPGYRDCMIGAHAASLMADAYVKGIRDFDADLAWQAMVKDAEQLDTEMKFRGRVNGDLYNKYGYIPYDIGQSQNVARTLEYAYDDFCMTAFARAAGRPEKDYAIYQQRALNYKNLFDPSVGFMRPKKADGKWRPDFNEYKWGQDYTEGGAWHYTWSVFQDPAGLIALFGGREKFIAKMDAIFATEPKADWSAYGSKIHEIAEMEAGGMGQYAHGNQPIQHAIYLYDWAGEPWKAQLRARETLKKLYNPFPNGYCGDEDNGQTSAWYVFSALGMYPVCPGTPEYALGSPLFEHAVLKLENGKTLTIEAPGNSAQNIYIQAATLDGKPFTKNFLSHAEVTGGGTIRFEMGAAPNTARGAGPDDAPYSMSR